MSEFAKFNTASHPLVLLEGDYNNLLDHGLEKMASYIIRINGSYYEAIKGGTATNAGTIAYGGADNAGTVNGTDPQAVIQAAITALTSGGTVFIKEGTYPLGSALNGVDDLTIEGVRGATVLNISAGNKVIYFTGKSDWAVRDLILDGDSINPTYGNGLIYGYNGSNAVVENIECLNHGSNGGNYGAGIEFNTFTNMIVKNNYVHDNDGTGIKISLSNNFVVAHNYCVSNTLGDPIGEYGNIVVGASYDGVVEGNNLHHSTFGIEVTGTVGNPTHNIRIANNYVYGYTPEGANIAQDGIELYTSTYVYDCTVTGNVCEGWHRTGFSGNGIEVGGGNTPLHNTVIGNICKNNFHGIHVAGTHNIIKGNICYDDQGVKTQLYGIYEEATGDYNVFEGNIVLGNLTSGAVFLGSNSILKNNIGYVTENAGTDSIASGTTSKAVAHGCDYTPAASDIIVVFTENPTNPAGTVWVDTIGAANFTVNVENDPGGSNLDFAWAVRKR